MDELVQKLTAAGTLRTLTIIAAFRTVDRKWFVRHEDVNEAYGDYPLPIGYGQTISQPTTVAFMLELLQARPGEKILDVGTGSGWTTALLSHLVGPSGKVYGVEIVPDLVDFGRANLERAGITNATIQKADAVVVGLPTVAPFDCLLTSASASELPESLVVQLRPGGTMVLPVGNAVWRVKKGSGTTYTVEKFPGFVFVPLIEKLSRDQSS